eukprot:TRINITY_DN28823_c0_g1_i2.p1 TRINITY_DN28823_c0_g1~~TRINITY_DN28823_c0_g1_i2.p1  ORF type:complete len:213 (-),score=37.52 TRINITY_DN28823_c0_g1_i2:65-703(-)
MCFFFNDTATTEIYTRSIVGSVRCVQETDAEYMGIVKKNALVRDSFSDPSQKEVRKLLNALIDYLRRVENPARADTLFRNNSKSLKETEEITKECKLLNSERIEKLINLNIALNAESDSEDDLYSRPVAIQIGTEFDLYLRPKRKWVSTTLSLHSEDVLQFELDSENSFDSQSLKYLVRSSDRIAPYRSKVNSRRLKEKEFISFARDSWSNQ